MGKTVSGHSVNDLLFLLALLALPVMGCGFASLSIFRSLHPASRVGLAGCLGALALCSEMLLLTALRIPWSVWLLLCPAALWVFTRRGLGARPRARDRKTGGGLPAMVLTLLVLAATAFAAVSARATSPDLLFFWGTKGQRFAQVRGIDAAFLRDPAHLFMHPGYPPMLPCLYAWAALVAGKFAWGGAILSLPVFLSLAVLTFFGFARRAFQRLEAAELTSLLAASLALAMVAGYTAGNAEPLLVYFEVTALSALVFAADRPEGFPAAAAALAGATLTKMEGLVFAALAVAGAMLFIRETRHWRRLALLAGAPAAALGAWILFCRSHRFPDVFELDRPSRPSFTHLHTVLADLMHQASYGSWFVPWIVLIIVSVTGRRARTSLFALTVGLGFGAFVVYAYLTRVDNPHLWIVWSASRALLTPLVCLFFCAAARVANPKEASQRKTLIPDVLTHV